MAAGAHYLRTYPLNYMYMEVDLVYESSPATFGRFDAKDDGGVIILFVTRRLSRSVFPVVWYRPIPRYLAITR